MSTDNYFSRRWDGRVPLTALLWQDMLGVGTFVNLAASVVAFAALINEAPTVIAVVIQLAPLPFNAFLLGAVWRSPGRNPFALTLAGAWFAVMMVI